MCWCWGMPVDKTRMEIAIKVHYELRLGTNSLKATLSVYKERQKISGLNKLSKTWPAIIKVSPGLCF